jgi:hypothetical protein
MVVRIPRTCGRASHSVGRWEGDTLVIETVGFNEKTWIQGSYPTTKQLKVTERLARPALNLLTYRVTIDDPGAYTKPRRRLEQFAVASRR